MGTRKLLVWALAGVLTVSLLSVALLYADEGIQPSGVQGPAPEVSQSGGESDEAAGVLPAGTVIKAAPVSLEEPQVDSKVKLDASGVVSGQAVQEDKALDLKAAGVDGQ
jgi:hypothetical protein